MLFKDQKNWWYYRQIPQLSKYYPTTLLHFKAAAIVVRWAGEA